MRSSLSPVFDQMVQEILAQNAPNSQQLVLTVQILAKRRHRPWVDACLDMGSRFGVKVFNTRRWWRWRPRTCVYDLRVEGTVLDTYRWLVSCRRVAQSGADSQ